MNSAGARAAPAPVCRGAYAPDRAARRRPRVWRGHRPRPTTAANRSAARGRVAHADALPRQAWRASDRSARLSPLCFGPEARRRSAAKSRDPHGLPRAARQRRGELRRASTASPNSDVSAGRQTGRMVHARSHLADRLVRTRALLVDPGRGRHRQDAARGRADGLGRDERRAIRDHPVLRRRRPPRLRAHRRCSGFLPSSTA